MGRSRCSSSSNDSTRSSSSSKIISLHSTRDSGLGSTNNSGISVNSNASSDTNRYTNRFSASALKKRLSSSLTSLVASIGSSFTKPGSDGIFRDKFGGSISRLENLLGNKKAAIDQEEEEEEQFSEINDEFCSSDEEEDDYSVCFSRKFIFLSFFKVHSCNFCGKLVGSAFCWHFGWKTRFFLATRPGPNMC